MTAAQKPCSQTAPNTCEGWAIVNPEEVILHWTVRLSEPEAWDAYCQPRMRKVARETGYTAQQVTIAVKEAPHE